MLIGAFFGSSRILMIVVLAFGVLLSWLAAIRRRDGCMRPVPKGVSLLAASSSLVSTAHGALTVLPNVSLSDLHVSLLLLAEALLLLGAIVWGMARCGLWGVCHVLGMYCVGIILGSFVFSLVVMVSSAVAYVLSLLGAAMVLLGFLGGVSGDYRRGSAVRIYDRSGEHLGYYDDDGNVRDQSGSVVLEKSGRDYYDDGGDAYELDKDGNLVARR